MIYGNLKKFLASLLAVLMVVTSMPYSAYAAENIVLESEMNESQSGEKTKMKKLKENDCNMVDNVLNNGAGEKDRREAIKTEQEVRRMAAFWRSCPFYCIGNKNKPPAMQVCSEIALASSITSNDIISAGSPTAQIIQRRYPGWIIIV